MSDFTVQMGAMRLLPYIGVTSLSAQASGSELPDVTQNDLDAVATAFTGAMQEIWDLGPLEMREQPGSAFIHAPTSVTLTATKGSTTISALTTYASWMLGCTIQISGDNQDNELISATKLARPYTGTSGSGITATVYCDAITMDDTVGQIIAPVEIPNQWPLIPATNRIDFIRFSGAPLVANADGTAYGYPFFYFYRKVVSRPRAWFVEGFYTSSLGYLPRRLRITPLPDAEYSLAWRSSINPPRYTATNIGGSPVVTGTLSPDAAGTYTQIGFFDGQPLYMKAGAPSFFIYHYPIDNVWAIGTTPTSAVSAGDRFSTNVIGGSMDGTYTAIGSYTGTATVTSGDPGTLFPIPNGWIESILLPMALQRFTAHPNFRNESAKAEIGRQYKQAVASLRNSRAQGSLKTVRYV